VGKSRRAGRFATGARRWLWWHAHAVALALAYLIAGLLTLAAAVVLTR
jgi:hypothetical protein